VTLEIRILIKESVLMYTITTKNGNIGEFKSATKAVIYGLYYLSPLNIEWDWKFLKEK